MRGGLRVSSGAMFTGTAVFDLLLPGDSRSLKAKRSYVRPIVAALRRFEVSAAEVGALDLHGRAQLAVAVVAAEASHVREVLDSCERLVAGRPETELLSVRRRLYGEDD
ncbi:hypothetical protein SAMN05444858_12835 [Micromonospora avicenniae]|uniref:DUF503 domain-containing protein n=2 Tax=Micromonospora avicenniae TaxID=1198245 RepID=A0A1N7EXQ6_9ACTN|nr:hypothetical protein SAMN05444858_12835 [Micromonospora avicenniae]